MILEAGMPGGDPPALRIGVLLTRPAAANPLLAVPTVRLTLDRPEAKAAV
jgi:hypothetical protein